MPKDHSALIAALAPAMHDAGALIERIKAAGLTHSDKADASPVTQADTQAEALLEAAIRAADPDAVIVGEEAVAAGIMPDPCGRFWLIDPLDGTRDFIAGRSDYSVNIGLVEAGVPVLGLVLHPPTNTLWAGARGLGAWVERDGMRTAIRTRAMPPAPRIVTSHSHLDERTKAWVATIPDAIITPSGSSLKFCLLAEGLADLYPRFGPTSEWDTAAADAILRAAGGLTLGPDATHFPYAKPGYRNGAFLAIADPACPLRLV
ncbi:3'(2'),5'-bisphosphate nucleotidase CysQ family protein [Sandaracinobacteroides saxicola]|uniref:3'(2'),5'-bisphosphate nucleotidase CysQ n=1 Tax=Sandaracinobacteroides saxicola TaxID=2759707 RepID=A0A7G5IDV3_9SPHN|nr:3'(2'),5'-bisphosphate nucleotidase CysQ [Sandaracinobacteroides saxicola]QMW21545.1 3'(2'),5'-bisphosphate nucleotidase CysQ [Sandaracinobacteroides saxicola]